MSKRFEDLLTAYMVARDHVETENRKYGLFEEKPTLDVAIQERREARQKLLAYVAELESARRWIPVSEGLPKRGQPVLVLTKGEGIMIDKLVPDMPTPDGVMWWMHNLSYFITHWMPLPEPPEPNKTQGA